MQFKRMLAKSSSTPDQPKPEETLVGHSERVLDVADSLLKAFGTDCLKAVGLPASYYDDFCRAGRIAAIIHDALGKPNDHFQRMVRKVNLGQPQSLRHEVVGLFALLSQRELFDWLFADEVPLCRRAVLQAVVGHHLKFDGRVDVRPSGERSIVIFADHPDVQMLLDRIAQRLGLKAPPQLKQITVDLVMGLPLEIIDWVNDEINGWETSDEHEKKFVALVKGLLIACDLAASALPRLGRSPADWALEALKRVCTKEDLKAIALGRLQGKSPRPFQLSVEQSDTSRTIVLAGCGTGKTTAAYLWATKTAPGRKLFFCYPTTGTATEGFRDYLVPHPEIDSRLIHSRAQMDLQAIQSVEPDEETSALLQKAEALAAWDPPIVICTVDTVLGVIQNQRRSLFTLPSILSGAFVFDEIHAYDDSMFRSLLRFLETFVGLPVLLMSASLQPTRRRAIENLLQRLGTAFNIIEGPAELEELKRYTLRLSDESSVWETVVDALKANQKVLWVCNTVDRVMNVGQEAELARKLGVLPYHSRYKYIDRIARHEDVIQAFREPGPVLAITTQVCEMSLDLSADLLITELAPIASLIQRLGRLNRRATPDEPGQPRRCLVLVPENPLPYKREELDLAIRWISTLGSGDLSQRDLAQAFWRLSSEETTTRIHSAWLDGGPVSIPATFRQPGHTVSIILAEDAAAARRDPADRIAVTIPMPVGPVKDEIRQWPSIGTARVAPVGYVSYSERWGASWVLQPPQQVLA